MATKFYCARETPIVFRESTGDAVLTFKNLNLGEGRISARFDRGAGSKPLLYKWKASVAWETAPSVGEYAEFVLAESDGTIVDGTVGTADAAMTAGQMSNLPSIGLVKAQTTDTHTLFVKSGYCLISEQYFSVGVWNASTGYRLENTTGNVCLISFTPVVDESQ